MKKFIVFGVLAFGCVGCGSSTTKTVTQPPTATSSSASAPGAKTSTSASTSTSAVSPANCQFADGKWITNVESNPTACVPDPSYASGDIKGDEVGVVPRCLKCTMAQWYSAEAKARRANQPTSSSATHAAPPPHHSTPSYASTFPSSFEESFTVQCLNTSGGNRTGCACVLRHIEAAVPFSTVAAAEHAIAIGEDPAWYTAAANACRS